MKNFLHFALVSCFIALSTLCTGQDLATKLEGVDAELEKLNLIERMERDLPHRHPIGVVFERTTRLKELDVIVR